MADKPALSPPASANKPLRADRPQRYNVNYAKYRARGGQIGLDEDLERFVAGDLNRGDMARFYFFCLAFDQLVKEGVSGDFAELGVYKGNTAALLASYARRMGVTAYLLDTYEGFNDLDLTGIDASAKSKMFSDTSLEAVRLLVGEENTRFVKGYFPETASQLPADGSYCLVHIDCDLFAPMMSALEYFYDRLAPGGYLIVHDYASLHWNGAEKAIDEFFADKPECVICIPDGAGSVAIRKARFDKPGNTWLDRERRSVFSSDWTPAANGRLLNLHFLGAGWSGPESWGVWGVGELHVLHLTLPVDLREGFEVDFDAQAALTDVRKTQEIDVFVGGHLLTTWTFTLEANRAIRCVTVPKELVERNRKTQSTTDIEFRPRSVVSTALLKSASSDSRSLGLGLHRVRIRQN